MCQILERELEKLGTVLIVDDEDDFLEILSRAVTSFSSVRTANSIRGATEMIALQKFDLLVVDIHLVDGLGFDIVELVGKYENWAPSIIFITGMETDQVRQRCWVSGAEDFISKPFILSEFSAKIRNKLENIAALRSEYRSALVESKDKFDFGLIGIDRKNRGPKEVEFLEALVEQLILGMSDLDLNLDKVAQNMCLSRRSFQRQLHAITETTFPKILANFRIHAADKLVKKDYTVKEISLLCGFRSASYLSVSYKKTFGVSPTKNR